MSPFRKGIGIMSTHSHAFPPQTRIARRTYKLALPGNLEPGEYAFLAPGLTNSSVSGSIGKAYTFRIVE